MTAARTCASALLMAILGGMVGAVVGGKLLTGVSSVGARVIRGERYELLDQTGRTIATWGPNSTGNVVLCFMDRRGAVRSELGVTKDGEMQWLSFYGPDKHLRVSLAADEYTHGSLNLGDEHRESRILLGSIPGDLPRHEESWGLVFPRESTLSNWIAIGVNDAAAEGKPVPFVSVTDSKGRSWVAPVGR